MVKKIFSIITIIILASGCGSKKPVKLSHTYIAEKFITAQTLDKRLPYCTQKFAEQLKNMKDKDSEVQFIKEPFILNSSIRGNNAEVEISDKQNSENKYVLYLTNIKKEWKVNNIIKRETAVKQQQPSPVQKEMTLQEEPTESLLDFLQGKKNLPYKREDVYGTLSERRDIKAIEPLVKMLELNLSKTFASDHQDTKRIIDTLAAIGDNQVIEPLIKAVEKGYTKYVVKSAINALEKFKDNRVVEPIIKAIEKDQKEVKETAIKALENMDRDMIEPIIKALEKRRMVDNSKVRDCMKCIIERLGVLGDARAFEPLRDVIESNHQDDIVNAAIQSIGKFNDDRTVETIINVFEKHKSYSIRQTAIQVLQNIGDSKKLVDHAIKALERTVSKKGVEYAVESLVEILGISGESKAVDPLLSVLEKCTDNLNIEQNTLKALEKINDPRVIDPIITLLKGKQNINFGTYAVGTLEKIGGYEALIKVLENCQADSVLEPAIKAIGKTGDSRSVAVLKKIAETSKYESTAAVAIEALGDTGDSSVPDILINIIKNAKSYYDRKAFSAAKALGKAGTRETIPKIMEIFRETKSRSGSGLRSLATQALAGIVPAVAPLLPLVNEDLQRLVSRSESLKIFEGLIERANKENLDPMEGIRIILSHPDQQLRMRLLSSLRNYDKKAELLPFLVKTLENDNDTRVKSATIKLILELSREDNIWPLLEQTIENTNDCNLQIDIINTVSQKSMNPNIYPFLEKCLKNSKHSQVQFRVVDIIQEIIKGYSSDKLNPAVLTILEEVIANGKDWEIRNKAVELIVYIGERTINPKVPVILEKALKDENENVRVTAMKGLGKIRNTDAYKKIQAGLEGKDSSVREIAIKSLKDPVRFNKDTSKNFETVLEALKDQNENVRLSALEVFEHRRRELYDRSSEPDDFFEQRARDTLLEFVKKENVEKNRDMAIGLYLAVEDHHSLEFLRNVMKTSKVSLNRELAAHRLALTQGEEVSQLLMDHLKDSDEKVVNACIKALVWRSETMSVPMFIEMINKKETNYNLREVLFNALAYFGDKRAIKPIWESVKDPHMMDSFPLRAIALFNDKDMFDPIMDYMFQKNSAAAAEALGWISNPESKDKLEQAIKKNPKLNELSAVKNLFQRLEKSAKFQSVVNRLGSDAIERGTESELITPLYHINTADAYSEMIKALRHKNVYIRRYAASYLIKPTPECVKELLNAMDDPDVCMEAALALGNLGRYGYFEGKGLQEKLKSDKLYVRLAAASALEIMNLGLAKMLVQEFVRLPEIASLISKDKYENISGGSVPDYEYIAWLILERKGDVSLGNKLLKLENKRFAPVLRDWAGRHGLKIKKSPFYSPF